MAKAITYCKIPHCDNRCAGQNLCRKHYMRFYRHGDPLATPRFCSLEERFWRYVDKTDTCWNWTGANCVGYGYFAVSQRPTKSKRAHRFSYELLNGPIPSGFFLHHTCENTLCVNPAHLIPTTPKKHRFLHRVSHCKHGHSLEFAYIYKHGPKKGHRKCRPCEARRMRKKRSISSCPRS